MRMKGCTDSNWGNCIFPSSRIFRNGVQTTTVNDPHDAGTTAVTIYYKRRYLHSVANTDKN